MEFPAVADFEVTGALAAAAGKWDRAVHIGVVQSKDSFYGQHSPEESPVACQLQTAWQAWLKGGCLASEMETAALYTVAAARGLRAGCVLQVIWNQEREKGGAAEPARGRNRRGGGDRGRGACPSDEIGSYAQFWELRGAGSLCYNKSLC